MKPIFRSPLQLLITAIVALLCITTVTFFVHELLFNQEPVTAISDSEIFPVSVYPERKLIVASPRLESYLEEHLSLALEHRRRDNFIDKLYAQLVQFDFYQQLASPLSRVLVIYPGQRKEEITEDFSDILRWDAKQREEFIALVNATVPGLTEGTLYPGHYTVAKTATPGDVALLLQQKFTTEILNRYDYTVVDQVPLTTALTIASLLEREAYDFTDMRIISGVIWNRLFIDMPLQLDATLQYVRGSRPTEPKWWPKVVPQDKFIDSPFNTYEVTGLPPAPIANPSVEAVVAALNPVVTSCYFYFHEDDGTFHCTDTYEEHVAALRALYGRGR